VTPAAQPTPAYTFDNDAPAAAERLDLSSAVLDGFTTSRLASLGDLTGRRCLELGAGNGSIAGWLADQAGRSGQVLATDINTRHIPADRGYAVVRHDLTADPLPDGPWDLIHARLVLRHLPARHDILRRLAATLAPGGALAIEQWDPYRVGLVLAAPQPVAATLFYDVETVVERLVGARAVDLEWPWQVHAAMASAGLVEVDTAVHARSWPGGSAGALHYAATISLLRPRILEAGMTGEQLDRLSELLRGDPRMVVRGLLTISTVGRRPGS
jgi:SAM-dependent methyltransferase